MRLNRETISSFVNNTLTRRTQVQRDLLAVYLCGSFLGENYLLGGSGDVDLVFVYNDKPEEEHEVIRITDEFHLEIFNRTERVFRDKRSLRVDPWLGPEINNCKILFDPQHFMDFVQASVRGQFERPDHVYQRAKGFADQGRAAWIRLFDESAQATQAQSGVAYLQAVGMAVNAAASLSGPPLPERRLMLEFPQRAEEIGEPGLYQGLLGLLGANNLTAELIIGWVNAWEKAFGSIQQADRPGRLDSARKRYYLGAYSDAISHNQIFSTLWSFLETWTQMAALIPEGSEDWMVWQRAFGTLELIGPSLSSRIQALDALLDNVEEILDDWARKNGV